jgi:hypothetical protein
MLDRVKQLEHSIQAADKELWQRQLSHQDAKLNHLADSAQLDSQSREDLKESMQSLIETKESKSDSSYLFWTVFLIELIR